MAKATKASHRHVAHTLVEITELDDLTLHTLLILRLFVTTASP